MTFKPPFMLDRDVARAYGVVTKRLMEQVRRNESHFDGDMLFQLSPEEAKVLRSQNATGKANQFLPFGFTRLGANHVAYFLQTEEALARAKQISRSFIAFEDI